MYKPQVVITHFPCSDGATSAGIISHYYEDSDIEFVKGDYANKDIDFYIEAVRGKDVFMADFSFKHNQMNAIISAAKSIVVLDHHVTAMNELQPFIDENIGHQDISTIDEALNNTKAVIMFDMERSGAMMTWDFFHPGKQYTPFVSMIGMIDLGDKNFDHAEEFMWFSRSIPLTAEAHAVYIDNKDVGSMFEQGLAIWKFVKNRMEVLQEQSREGNMEGLSFKWVITDYLFASEMANSFVKEGYDMGVVIYFGKDTVGISLRSREGIDVSQIAASMGGGGHKQAAGVNIPFSDIPELLEAVKPYGITF